MKTGERIVGTVCLSALLASGAGAQQAPTNGSRGGLVLPMERTAYFVGETVPLAITGLAPGTTARVEAAGAGGRTLLYAGPAAALWLDTAKLAPGDYALELNGAPVVERFTLTSTLRKSAASLQDEATPSAPQLDARKKYTPEEAHALVTAHWDKIVRTLQESGLTACLALGASDMGRADYLDAMTRAGTMLLVNPDTRPTSFLPVWNNPDELASMSQRMILTAQANGRYPNFGGFCYGWDTTGYAVGGRRMLLVYWGWADKTQALRNYIDRVDKQKTDEFTRRTGLKPVTEEEYIAYLLAIGRPEFGPAIDLPTKLWLEEIARYTKPMPEAERADFERRLDAWSDYLMGLYHEAYGTLSQNLRGVAPALRHTSSVQSDHCVVRAGQYFPSAYAPLDFRYQSTWNDQVGGPDYIYQWLFISALLEMQRGEKPVWISNALGTAHERAAFPGKFVRVAAHDLAFGGSGLGFACEGFSNILGGMNRDTNWEAMKGKAGEADLVAGRDFLQRFAALALEGGGEHGVGVLWSRSQYARQNIAMGFGDAVYQALVALTRLGYTPRYVTEEELVAGQGSDVKALVVVGQTFPLPPKVMAGLDAFRKNGGRIIADGSTTVRLPGAEPLGHTFAFTLPGKPHNWGAPNMVGIENDTILYERWHPALAKAFSGALGDTGHASLRSERGAETKVSLLQLQGGADAHYVVAVNDSYIGTQADWHQVQERLLPGKGVAPEAVLYDCTDEKLLGKAEPFVCDLATTIARVYALLARPVKSTALAASQNVRLGESLLVRVAFKDAAGKPLAAVLPFHLAVIRPDGQPFQEFYRATTRAGTFSMELPVPLNAPAGKWTVAVRSQLTGDVASLPVTVREGRAGALAAVMNDAVLVRGREAAEAAFAKGNTVVVPLFGATNRTALLRPVAEKVKDVLARRGVTVEIWEQPAVTNYTLAYDPTEAQQAVNARVDKGEVIGRIRRETVNANDWYSALSGWRFGRPLILLDLAMTNENPMANSLHAAGILWPAVSESFPGQGRAVVEGVPWAFAPRMPTVVIRAAELDGLMAGAQALGKLPEDRLTPGLQAVQGALWREFHIGGKPEQPAADKCTSKGVTVTHATQPFAIAFPGERPPPADQVKHPEPGSHGATNVPGIFGPSQYVIFYRVGSNFVETATAGMLVPDLRFSEAVMVIADVKQAGKMTIAAEGVFRYSDRTPCWQAQWEDIINLRDKLVPRERRPLEFEVVVNGKPAGKLVPVKTEQKDVTIEMMPRRGPKAEVVNEEVVTRAAGEVDLPAGRAEIMLIEKNVVDGKLNKVVVGVAP